MRALRVCPAGKQAKRFAGKRYLDMRTTGKAGAGHAALRAAGTAGLQTVQGRPCGTRLCDIVL